jgi:hypothetical protein
MKDRLNLERLFRWDRKRHDGGFLGYLSKCRKTTVSQSRELAEERFTSEDGLLIKLLGFLESKKPNKSLHITWAEADSLGIKRKPQ